MKQGNPDLVGRKIVDVRSMTNVEMEMEGWEGRPSVALVLDNGTVLYASMDEEGSGPRCMFGVTGEGKQIAFF